MPFTINEGEKFARIAFTNIALAPDLAENVPLDLGGDTWVLDRPHFAVREEWRQWIGSIKADQLRESNLLLLVKRRSTAPEILDEENQSLLKDADALFYGLLLQGLPEHVAAYRFTGAVQGGQSNIRQFSEPYNHHAFGKRTRVLPEMCRVAYVAASGIKEMLSPTEFLRLQRGFKALVDATRARYGDDALHQFVRAMDALIMPRVTRSRNDFAHRGQTFTATNEPHWTILQEIYDIRSNVEHMHEWDGSCTAEAAKRNEPVLLQRLHQIEALALAVYLKIMTSTPHRDIFRSNSSIEAFWALADDERRTVWGQGLDLSIIH